MNISEKDLNFLNNFRKKIMKIAAHIQDWPYKDWPYIKTSWKSKAFMLFSPFRLGVRGNEVL